MVALTRDTVIHRPELSVLDGEIGEGCTIHAFVWIGKGAVVGRDCRIQAFAYIPPGVIIGDRVFIGPHVTFTNDKHPPTSDFTPETTVVGDGAVIGANATILSGLMIGEHATVGAGSVVTKDVPPRALVVGNPARYVVR